MMNRRTFLERAGQAALVAAAGRFTALRPAAAGEAITLAAVGDCILTRKVQQLKNERFLQIVKLLRDADCAYGNCEMTFVDARHAEPTPKGADMNLVCEPWGTDELAWMGFDIVGTANNHSMDYGREGLVSTVANLERAGIGHAGTGVTLGEAARPGYVDTPNGRVALVNCASTFPAWSLAEAARADSNGRPGLNPLRVERTYRVEPAVFEELKIGRASCRERVS
jgi:poly-gamma-glutamate synthesis protein (capsule biosynthesis protein)